MIVCEDNLSFMSKLKDRSIDLIYCDVLFGTGNKFKDYKDPKFSSFDGVKKFYFHLSGIEPAPFVLRSETITIEPRWLKIKLRDKLTEI